MSDNEQNAASLPESSATPKSTTPHQLAPTEMEIRQRSKVIAELLMDDPELTQDAAEALYDEVSHMNSQDTQPDGWICIDRFTVNSQTADDWRAHGWQVRAVWFSPPSLGAANRCILSSSPSKSLTQDVSKGPLAQDE